MPPLNVFHYESERGRDLIGEFLDSLPVGAAAKCSVVIGWLVAGEIDQHPKLRDHLDGEIWELRVRHQGEQYRILYATDRDRAYLLVPLHKKTQKIDRKDIELAKRRLREMRARRRGS